MTNFTKSGNRNSSFTAISVKNMVRLQDGENDGGNNSSRESNSNEIDEDPEGVGERGFSQFTWSIPVIYLRQWLNEKPEQTNFCSRKLPVAAQFDSLTGVASGTMQTPAPGKAVEKKDLL